MAETPIYILNNGEKGVEENRLTYQHKLFLKMTKTLLPSNIQEYLSSIDRAPAIADVGAGTGVWLRDLAPQLPKDARLDGYDIDPSKFLPREELPANISLTYGDVLKPFPHSMQGQYDLVHVRLLMFALKRDEWVTAAANLQTLLKPGGYLLWDETGLSSWTAMPMTDTFKKWIETDVRYGLSVGRDVTSPMKLCNHLKGARYQECTHEEFSTYSEPDDVQKMASNGLVNVGRQSLHGIVDRGGYDWLQTHQQVDELFDQLQSEVDKGETVLGFVITWAVGRKPEA